MKRVCSPIEDVKDVPFHVRAGEEAAENIRGQAQKDHHVIVKNTVSSAAVKSAEKMLFPLDLY